jgi:hypothetical protein
MMNLRDQGEGAKDRCNFSLSEGGLAAHAGTGPSPVVRLPVGYAPIRNLQRSFWHSEIRLC